ncbi:MAG TPA: hypothetical protein VK399_08195 [Longimicrobiaceae bacterium]|jgi:hypothetical protein|nr:hypothetical protein [Longimicrobiaceae bacterium]
MSTSKLRVLTMALFLGAGSLVAGVSPAFACHEDTGWCCTHDGFCCYFYEDKLLEETCGR